MNFEKRVFENVLQTLESIGAKFIVHSEFGNYTSDEIPIELIVNQLDAIKASYTINVGSDVYKDSLVKKRNLIHKDLAHIFERIKPGMVAVVNIPGHIDFESARSCIINHYNSRPGNNGVTTKQVSRDPECRQLKVYLAPAVEPIENKDQPKTESLWSHEKHQ